MPPGSVETTSIIADSHVTRSQAVFGRLSSGSISTAGVSRAGLSNSDAAIQRSAPRIAISREAAASGDFFEEPLAREQREEVL